MAKMQVKRAVVQASSLRDPIVYDVGMNNGDDSAYYLRKGFRVVGIEANPGLCASAAHRFAAEIAAGRMTIVNAGVGAASGVMPFYIHKFEDALSTFDASRTDDFYWIKIPVEMRRLSGVIAELGEPYFVKIDVEYLDPMVLRDLYDHGIRPPYISAEAQTIEVYCALVFMGYEAFTLVEGAKVPSYDRVMLRDGTSSPYVFPLHSSGPFGEDIAQEWCDKDVLLRQLLQVGLGWVDIHARVFEHADRRV